MLKRQKKCCCPLQEVRGTHRLCCDIVGLPKLWKWVSPLLLNRTSTVFHVWLLSYVQFPSQKAAKTPNINIPKISIFKQYVQCVTTRHDPRLISSNDLAAYLSSTSCGCWHLGSGYVLFCLVQVSRTLWSGIEFLTISSIEGGHDSWLEELYV
jgi:hypothetical protein